MKQSKNFTKQVIPSEAAHLVWVSRCERVIHGTQINENEINKRWHYLTWVLRCECVIQGKEINERGIKNRWHPE